MLIETLNLQAGSSPGQPPLVLDKPHFTVLIGPNNSGKSLLIREINAYLTSGPGHTNKVLDALKFANPPGDQLNRLKISPPTDQRTNDGWSWYKIGNVPFQYPPNQMENAFADPNTIQGSKDFASQYASKKTLNLDGASRLSLLSKQLKGDLKNPTSSLAKLFVNNKKRDLLRKSIVEAFGLYFGLDVSVGDSVSMRFGKTPPPSDERSLNDDALEWHSDAKPLEDVSDGVRAFSGILTELAAGDPTTFLIDEPEAFLHPALAFRLGKEIALSSLNENKQVFAATHSPQFLLGAIQSGVPINIVRLAYTNGEATARLLPNDDVRALMKDPLLRSANVLSGLFHESVIVTEADTDRAFYQEINERLLDQGDSRGIDNPFFINANGKDQLHRIAGPLRNLGVPTATIGDIDVLNQGGMNWTNHLAAYGVPQQQHQSLGQQRATIWEDLKTSGEPKLEGLSLLKDDKLEAAGNLFAQMAEYGFFIVHVGEVERWLGSGPIKRLDAELL